MPAPFIIPIFIAHQGCPHHCVFCNQHQISGQGEAAGRIGAAEVAAAIDGALGWPRRSPEAEVQVAFYGGSFTGLPRPRQAELLGAVAPYLADGRVAGLRLSTRPDMVDADGADFLEASGVRTVELGVQSMTPSVLTLCRRGHTADDVPPAVAALRQAGLAVGIQLMAGLPAETPATLMTSAKQVAALGPDFVRLYPTVVVAGSELAAWYAAGRYQPLSLARAVVLTARLKALFDAVAIPVVRMGLQHSAALAAALVAGPHHPAFGELVKARMLLQKIRQCLAGQPGVSRALLLSSRDQSLVRGKANAHLKQLARAGLLDGVRLDFRSEMPRGTVLVA